MGEVQLILEKKREDEIFQEGWGELLTFGYVLTYGENDFWNMKIMKIAASVYLLLVFFINLRCLICYYPTNENKFQS